MWINGQKWQALVDGGSQVPIVHPRVLGDEEIASVGNIHIQPIIGPASKAKLVPLDVAKYTEISNDTCKERPLHMVCAVAEGLVDHDVVLPSSVVDKLKETSQYSQLPCQSIACQPTVSTGSSEDQAEDDVIDTSART